MLFLVPINTQYSMSNPTLDHKMLRLSNINDYDIIRENL